MSELTFEQIEDVDALLALAGQGWDDLVRAQPRPSPFVLHSWLATWWTHYGDGQRLRLQVARRGGRLVAGLPTYLTRRRGVAVTRFLGGDHAELADILLAPGEPLGTACALLERASAGGDVCDFFGMPIGSTIERCAGDRLVLRERAEAPVLDLAADFCAAYERRFAAKRRYEHRRKRKRLAELGELTTRVASRPNEVAAALEQGFGLHAKRWRGLPDRSDFVTPRGMAFHRDGYRRLAEQDVIRIVTLDLNGLPIAFHAYAVLCRTLYSDRMAYDVELARFSPGFLNTLDMLEEAAREGVTRAEFLGGAEEYKLHLADRLEPLQQGFGLAASTRGRAYAQTRVRALELRRALKRSKAVRSLYYAGLAPVRRAGSRFRTVPTGR